MNLLLEYCSNESIRQSTDIFFCKSVKLCTYVHLVWACHGRGRLGEAVHWVWIDGNGDHKPAHAQEAEKESHARALHGQNPPHSRFLGYSGPDGACKWVIWAWESSSGSQTLHYQPHLRLRVLNIDAAAMLACTTCGGCRYSRHEGAAAATVDSPAIHWQCKKTSWRLAGN